MLTCRGTVYPWHCGHVGHMNVMWHVGAVVSIHTPVKEAHQKRVTFVHEMRNAETGEGFE